MKGENIMKTQMTYEQVKELATIGNIKFEVGHYLDEKGKATTDKVYGFENRTGVKGKEYYNIVLKLSVADFNEMVKAIGTVEVPVPEVTVTETVVNSTFTYGDTKPKRKTKTTK